MMLTVRELALAVAEAVRGHVGHAVHDLPRAEARGYLRARSAPVVAAHVKQLVDARPVLAGRLAARLQAEAHEAVVRLLVDEVMRDRATQAGNRRAA